MDIILEFIAFYFVLTKHLKSVLNNQQIHVVHFKSFPFFFHSWKMISHSYLSFLVMFDDITNSYFHLLLH